MNRPNKKDYEWDFEEYFKSLEKYCGELEKYCDYLESKGDCLSHYEMTINVLEKALNKACEELSLCYVGEDKTEEDWKVWCLDE